MRAGAEGAVVVFSDAMEDYLPVVFVRSGGIEMYNYSPLVYARGCENVAETSVARGAATALRAGASVVRVGACAPAAPGSKPATPTSQPKKCL